MAAIGTAGQLEIDGERRIEVGKGFQRNGNTVVALRGERVEFDFSHGKASEMTGVMRTGALRRRGARREIRGASDANRAIRARYAESSCVREVFESEGLPVGGKEIGY